MPTVPATIHPSPAPFVSAFAAVLLAALPAQAQEFAGGHLFLVTQDSKGILEYDRAGTFIRYFGENLGIDWATHVRFGPDGYLYVADRVANRVWVVDATGAKVRELVDAQLSAVLGLAFGSGGHVVASSSTNDRIVEFAPNGSFVRSIGVGSGIDLPAGLCFGPNGHLFAVSGLTQRIIEFDPKDSLVRELGVGAGLVDFGDVQASLDGHLLVVCSGTDAVVKLTATGAKAGEFGNAAIQGGGFSMALRSDGRVLVGDLSNDVVVLDETGAAQPKITVPSNLGKFSPVTGMAFAPYRFEARIKGKLSRPGLKDVTRNEKGIVSWYPGSSMASLTIEDTPSADDLATAAQKSVFVFHGIAARGDDPGKRARFSGMEIADATLATGWSHLSMAATGKAAAGPFAPSKVQGRFEWTSGGASFSGTLTTVQLKK